MYSLGFMSLPLELRFVIYRLLYANVQDVRIANFRSKARALNFRRKHHLAILGVDKQIRKEALSELGHGRTFYFPDASMLSTFCLHYPTIVAHFRAIVLGSSNFVPQALAGRLGMCENLTQLCVNIKKSSGPIHRMEQAHNIGTMLAKWLVPDRRSEKINAERFKGLEIRFQPKHLGSNVRFKLNPVHASVKDKAPDQKSAQIAQEEEHFKKMIKKILVEG